jgi:regulator of chromosome condensation
MLTYPSAAKSAAATKKPETPQEPTKPASKKRGRSSTADLEAAAKPPKRVKPSINTSPEERLDVYVFGAGENGELGLGNTVRNGKKPVGVKRPRLNDLLDAKTVGVVQIAVGGMHSVALTHDQKILTWGVNDNGALGRDTTFEAPTRDADASDDDEDDGRSLNPLESTPTAIPAEHFGKDVRFAQVAATDSASFALTTEGFVYGWGTFSVSFFSSAHEF